LPRDVSAIKLLRFGRVFVVEGLSEARYKPTNMDGWGVTDILQLESYIKRDIGKRNSYVDEMWIRTKSIDFINFDLNPWPLLGLRHGELALEYPSGIASEYGGDNGSANPELLKKGASILVVVVVVSALGIKLVSDGIDLAGESPNGGLARVALVFLAFAIAIPVLLFIALGFAHP
jgi:hypothetical protein